MTTSSVRIEFSTWCVFPLGKFGFFSLKQMYLLEDSSTNKIRNCLLNVKPRWVVQGLTDSYVYLRLSALSVLLLGSSHHSTPTEWSTVISVFVSGNR